MSRNFDLMSRAGTLPTALNKVPAPAQPDIFVNNGPSFDHETDLRRVVRILRKHWLPAVAFALATFVVTALATAVMSKFWATYSPVATIEVDPPGQEAFSMDRTGPTSSDPDYVGTQMERLKSDELAVSVVRQLHLDANSAFAKPAWYAPLTRIFKGSTDQGSNSNELALTPAENSAVQRLQRDLSVDRKGNSRLLTVSFTDHDPVLAANVTNTLVKSYLDGYYKSNYDAVMKSSEWLNRQLDDVRKKMEQSNDEVSSYQQKNGIADVDDKQSTLMQRAADINHQLTQAESDRIQYGAYLSRLAMGDAGSLPQVHDNLAIQGLKQQLATASGALSQAEAVYGPNHPNVLRLRGQVQSLQDATSHEEKKIAEGLKTSYSAASARQQMMAGLMKGMAGEMGKMAEYSQLKKNAQVNSDLYNALYQRVKEAGISAASKSSNITVGDRARILNQPTSPRLALNLAVGLFLGLLGGIVLAFVRENFDDSIHTAGELQNVLGSAPISIIPLTASTSTLGNHPISMLRRLRGAPEEELSHQKFVIERPRSPESEAIRGLKTSILLARLRRPAVVMIASSTPGEGKTTVAMNLAMSLAEQGRTCLIDADIRRSRIANAFGMDGEQGLTGVIDGVLDLESALRTPESVPNLAILPAGRPTRDPGSFIQSPAIDQVIERLKDDFEFLVVDSPPLLPFADARILSRSCDAVVLVSRWGVTSRQGLARSLQMLEEVQAPVLGFVLNGVDISTPEYGYMGYKTAYV